MPVFHFCSAKIDKNDYPPKQFAIRRESVCVYKELQCLDITYENAYRTYLPVAYFLFLTYHTTLNFTLIRIHSFPLSFIPVLVIADIVLFSFAHIWFSCGGSVSGAAEDLKLRMRMTTSAILHKEVDACPTLTVEIGSYMKLNSRSVIDYYAILTNLIIQVLLYIP